MRPVLLGCLLFLGMGYVLYAIAYLLPTPQWGRELMRWSMPVVKGLDTAARVGQIKGTDPYPAQVVILYGAWSSIALTTWIGFLISGNKKVRQLILLRLREKYGDGFKAQAKIFAIGLVGVFLCPFCLRIIFWFSVTNITWRDIGLYSSSFDCISFLLLAAIGFSLVISMSPIFLLLPFKNRPLQPK